MEPTAGIAESTAPHPSELAEAAKAWGIESSYWDMWGREHHASSKLVTAILHSLGVDARSSESLAKALEERAWGEWHPPVAPTLVVIQGETPPEIAISLTAAHADSEALLDIRFEAGGGDRMLVALGELPIAEESAFAVERLVRKRIRLSGALPLGYHELAIPIAGT